MEPTRLKQTKKPGPPRFRPNRSPLVLVASLVAAFLGMGCGGAQTGGQEAAVRKGRATFHRVCGTCHGKDAKGLPRLGKSLIDNAFTQNSTDDELVEFLKQGRSATDPLNETGVDMPPKGGDPTITDDDLRNVVVFLRTL